MRSIKKIQLEIYSEKEEQFYLSLLRYKAFPNSEDLELLADAIHFDRESLENIFTISPDQEQKINDKLSTIHKYLLDHNKFSGDYLKVSKETFEKFLASPFGRDLNNLFHIFELIKRFSGKEESAEVKSMAAVLSRISTQFTKGLKKSIGKSITGFVGMALTLKEMKQGEIKIEANEKGNLVYPMEEENIEIEVFVPKDGHYRKVKVTRNDNPFKGTGGFFKIGEIGVLLKENGNEIEVTQYKNIKTKNGELDLNQSQIISTFSILKSMLINNISQTETGSFRFEFKNAESEDAEDANEISANEEFHLTEALKEEQESKQDKETIGGPGSPTYNMVDESLAKYLKLPKDHYESVRMRDRTIIEIFGLIKKHYSISTHTAKNITGFIASRIGLVDTEDQYLDRDRKQPYLKYLRTSIENVLKRRSTL